MHQATPSPTNVLARPYEGASRLALERPRTAFFYGFAVSAALGLVLWFFVPLLRTGELGGSHHDGYWALAFNLIRGKGYVFEPGGDPVMHRPPLMPVLYAPLTLLPGPLQRPFIVLLQSLMVGGICAGLFHLASILLGVRSARVAVGLMLTYPWLYLHVNLPFSVVAQTLCALLVVNAVAGEIVMKRGQSDEVRQLSWQRSAGLLGLVGATASLAHGTMVFFTFFLLAGMGGIGVVRRRLRLIGVAVASGCLTAALIAPWTYRNWVVSHHFIPIANNAGFTYFYGVAHWHSRRDASVLEEQHLALTLAGIGDSVDEVVHCWGVRDPSLDALLGRRMIDHISAHPAEAGKRTVLNAIEYYFPFVHDLLKRPHYSPGVPRIMRVDRALLSVWHSGVLILAALGVWWCRRLPCLWSILALVCCILALAWPYFLLLARVRHSHYVLCTLPFLAVLASGMVMTRTDLQPRRFAAPLGRRRIRLFQADARRYTPSP